MFSEVFARTFLLIFHEFQKPANVKTVYKQKDKRFFSFEKTKYANKNTYIKTQSKLKYKNLKKKK